MDQPLQHVTLNGLKPELHIYLSADLTVEEPYNGKIFVIGIQNYRLYSQTPTIAQVMVDIRMEIQRKLVKSNFLPKPRRPNENVASCGCPCRYQNGVSTCIPELRRGI